MSFLNRLMPAPALDWPTPARYAAASCLFAAALCARILLLPVEVGGSFLTFFPASVLAFYLLGSGPGTAVTLLGAVAGHYVFTHPNWTLSADFKGWLTTAFYLSICALIGWIAECLHRTYAQRKTALDRLKVKTLALDQVLAQQSDAVVRFDRHRVVIFANDAYCSLCGLHREDIVGHAKWLPIAPEDKNAVFAQFQALQPSKRDLTSEFRVVTASGQLLWMQWAVHAEFDTAGGLLEVQGTGRDISERKRMEAEMQATSARVRNLFDHAPCGYHSLDAQGCFVEVNDTELGWLGATRQQVIGRSLCDFLTPRSAQQFLRLFGVVHRGESLSSVEFDCVALNGSIRRVSASVTPVLDAQHRYQTSRWVLFDITALHQSRQQSRALAAELGVTLDNDLVGMLRVRDRVTVWHNKALRGMFGVTADDLIGQSTRVLHLDDASFEAQGATAYAKLKAGGVFRTQTQMRRKDGTTFWADVCGQALGDEGSESLWSMTDITPIKQAEELRVQAAELSAENRYLREFAKLHKHFTANVSHEMRTPLNGILGMTHLLKRGVARTDEAKFSRYLGNIETSARELLGMVERVLDLSAAESGQLKLAPVPVALASIFEEAMAAIGPALKAKGIAARLEIDPEVGDACLDPMRLRQVLQAYLHNAAKFTPAGGMVTLRARAEGPQWLRCEVQDDGPGIAPTDHHRLFSNYRQLSEGMTKEHAGLGVGLGLVKRIVEAQGGRVGVESSPGQGSLFYAVLPTSSQATQLPSPVALTGRASKAA